MREEHWVRTSEQNATGTIDDTFSEAEAQEAIIERMRRTAAWSEHERYHEEQGGHAELLLRTEQTAEPEAAPQTRQFEADEPQARSRPILTGWCQCQSPRVRRVLGLDGDVENRPQEPIETNAYGVVADDAPTYGTGNTGAVQYKPGPSAAPNLYK